ncbi:MAG: hypothetical protein UR23_C0004G0014 [Candidatus Roizmanbacteria bacterium GW2011_GWA2_32_13]|uniref:Fimbrial assembly family protein n=1 Tax=Candidatus Roizmanbacteria bacterium GW2011_GWA2_32_13 TaxID=1618475 RepID=A0A0G0C271_9BACT|nr:MAG: hypothetical protein UR23_C0004G0014 [Candidatus Roizmanbacteria bacterium GW2011_GWA2_32_13]
MLYFNLLPKKIQQDTLYRNKNHLIVKYALLLIILMLILSVFLLFILLFTNSKKKIFEQKLQELQKNSKIIEIKKIEKEINQFNKELLSDINPIQETILSKILIELSKITPFEISLNNLINLSEQDWVLLGEAKNRNDLIYFEKSLKNSKIFDNIVSPLSNFSKNTNLNFKINFTLKEN